MCQQTGSQGLCGPLLWRPSSRLTVEALAGVRLAARALPLVTCQAVLQPGLAGLEAVKEQAPRPLVHMPDERVPGAVVLGCTVHPSQRTTSQHHGVLPTPSTRLHSHATQEFQFHTPNSPAFTVRRFVLLLLIQSNLPIGCLAAAQLQPLCGSVQRHRSRPSDQP